MHNLVTQKKKLLKAQLLNLLLLNKCAAFELPHKGQYVILGDAHDAIFCRAKRCREAVRLISARYSNDVPDVQIIQRTTTNVRTAFFYQAPKRTSAYLAGVKRKSVHSQKSVPPNIRWNTACSKPLDSTF